MRSVKCLCRNNRKKNNQTNLCPTRKLNLCVLTDNLATNHKENIVIIAKLIGSSLSFRAWIILTHLDLHVPWYSFRTWRDCHQLASDVPPDKGNSFKCFHITVTTIMSVFCASPYMYKPLTKSITHDTK